MPPRRERVQPDRILVARLDGTARRLSSARTPHDIAIPELHAITTRPDLLGIAAGRALAGTLSGQAGDEWAPASLALLRDAGADRAVAEAEAVLVAQRLREGGHSNP